MTETVRYSPIFREDLALGTGTREVTLADGRVVVLHEVSADTLGLHLPFLNVKDAPYNAVGDGVTDDTDAIQSAIDDAVSVNASTSGQDGAIVWVPRGKYKYSDTLNFGTNPCGIRLMGEGLWATRLQPTSGLAGKPLMLLVNQVECEVRDLMLEKPSSGAATYGIECRHIAGAIGAGNGRFTTRDIAIGLVGSGSIQTPLAYTNITEDANNELGYHERTSLTGTVQGVYIGHLNSLLHTFVDCLITAPVGMTIPKGSVRMIGGGFNCSTVAFDITGTAASGDYSASHPVVYATGVYQESAGMWIRQTATLASSYPSFKFVGCWQEGATASSTHIDIRATNAEVQFTDCRFNTGQAAVKLKVTGTGAKLRVIGGELGFDQTEFGATTDVIYSGVSWLSGAPTESGAATAPTVHLGSVGYYASSGLLSWIKNAQLNVINFLVDSLTNAQTITTMSIRFVRSGLTSWPGSPAVGDSVTLGVNTNGLLFTDNAGTTLLSLVATNGSLRPGTSTTGLANIFYGSAVYDAGNLVDGAGVTTTVTVTGCALGQFVIVSFSLDLQGITLTGYVSSANTVSVRFQNETTGAIDLASGTIYAIAVQVA